MKDGKIYTYVIGFFCVFFLFIQDYQSTLRDNEIKLKSTCYLPNKIFLPILSIRRIVIIFPGRLDTAVKKLSK